MTNFLNKFESNKLFTEDEGWMLFKLAAIGEACGWTLLIIGIGLSHYVFGGNQLPVQIAGRIHGTLFLFYVVASIGLYPTLRWSRSRSLVALLASVPPYGSLVFELWASSARKNQDFHIYRSCILLSLLT